MRPTPSLPAHVRAHILVWLAVGLVPAMAFTAFITRAHRGRQLELAAEWHERGEVALAAARPEDAVEAFRTALTFAHEDRFVSLRLAQALVAAGRASEARAYLLTLWDAQPGNGEVNLTLGRLAAHDRDVPGAIRYYHTAAEGAWPDNAEHHRRATRLELAEFLVREGVPAQAQAETIALAGDLPEDPALQLRVAHLLLAAGLPRRALTLYEGVLRGRPDDPAALAGAGRAAFAEANYVAAARFLTSARRQGSIDDDLKDMLETASQLIAADPFQLRLPARERRARVWSAFQAALRRLDHCTDRVGGDTSLQALTAEAAVSRRTVAPRTLERNPDLADAAMDLVFRIERQTAALCGQPEGLDRALLLIAQQRQGSVP